LADLSAVPVFGTTGIYVVLIAFQKKLKADLNEPTTTVIKCREFVGKALQDGIKNKFVDNTFYSVFEIEQNYFQSEQWSILPFKEIKLRKKTNQYSATKKYQKPRREMEGKLRNLV